MKYWLITHSHRHGLSFYIGAAEAKPAEEDVIATFDIDFEEDRDENLEVEEITDLLKSIPVLGVADADQRISLVPIEVFEILKKLEPPIPPRYFESPRGVEEVDHYSCPQGNYRSAPMTVEGRDDVVAYLVKGPKAGINDPYMPRLIPKSDLQVVLVDAKHKERRVPFDQWERERKPIT